MSTADSTSEATADHDWRRWFESRLQARLKAVFEVGRWLSVSEITQGAVSGAARLVEITGREPDDYVLALAARHGIGPLDESIPVLSLGVPEGDNILDGIRLAAAAMDDIPDEVVARINRWDPDGEARVMKSVTMSGSAVAGRPSFGGRRREWEELEDKLAILDLWDRAGVTQAPTRVVATNDPAAVKAAHRELAGPDGTVWAVDNDQGWHGGALGTHWVPAESMVDEALARLAPDHRKVRMMPFLDGVPCSIHGMVIDGEVISFCPSEMITFRDVSNRTLVYGKAANFWQPGVEVGDEMVKAVEAIGAELQRRVDFRGVFTLDGVAASSIPGFEGFVPTEVNTRYGAALPAVLPTLDGDPISLYFACRAEVEGELRAREHGVTPADLQRWVRDRLLETRQGLIMTTVARGPAGAERTAEIRALGPPDPDRGVTSETKLIITDTHNGTDTDPKNDTDTDTDSDTDGGEGGVVVATVRWGQMEERGLVFLTLDPAGIPVGPTVAPQALALLRAVDVHWDMGLADLEAAG